MMLGNYNIRFAALLLIISYFPTLAVRQRNNVDESDFRERLEEAGKSKSSTISESSKQYNIRFKRGLKAYSGRFEDAADQYHNGANSIAAVSHLSKGVRKSQFGNLKSNKKGNTVGRVKKNRGCSDSIVGWYDSDGPVYTCEWYALNDFYCAWYGNNFKNFGKTAKETCCSCGGGAKNASTSTNDTNRPGSNKDLPSSLTSSTKPPSFMANSKSNSARNPSGGTSSTKPPSFMANLRPNSSRNPSST